MKPRLPPLRTTATLDAIEWEELPSLVGRLHAATADAAGRMNGPAWEVTEPASLDEASPASTFDETMSGLAVREIVEPDLFRHFFGERSA